MFTLLIQLTLIFQEILRARESARMFAWSVPIRQLDNTSQSCVQTLGLMFLELANNHLFIALAQILPPFPIREGIYGMTLTGSAPSPSVMGDTTFLPPQAYSKAWHLLGCVFIVSV